MDDAARNALLDKTVADVTAELPSLSREDLSGLLALESAKEGGGRTTLIDAVVKEIDKRDAPEGEESDVDEATRKEIAPAAVQLDSKANEKDVAWQKPDYDGPLTIEQANWRHVNLKPAHLLKTK